MRWSLHAKKETWGWEGKKKKLVYVISRLQFATESLAHVYVFLFNPRAIFVFFFRRMDSLHKMLQCSRVRVRLEYLGLKSRSLYGKKYLIILPCLLFKRKTEIKRRILNRRRSDG
jgi:hypothetical protein